MMPSPGDITDRVDGGGSPVDGGGLVPWIVFVAGRSLYYTPDWLRDMSAE
jgi:hypothetical protein